MRLGPRTYDRLLRLLPEIYACRTLPELIKDAVDLLKPMIPSEGCGWFVFAIDSVPRLAMSAESEPPVTDLLSLGRQGQAALNHPLNLLWQKQSRPSTLMSFDVESRQLGRYLSEFRDVYSLIGQSTMTTPVSISGAEVSAFAYRRDDKPFSEEHRLIADLAQPHLQRAFQNARTFSALADAMPNATIIVDNSLTPRESHVAFWLSHGKTNREISLILKTAPRTVEKHVESILRKLHVENRTTAALTIRARFVSPTID